MWTLLREVSLRHLRHAPLRSALVVLGISLGVCLLGAVLATNDSLAAAFEEMVERVSGRADITVAGSDSGIPGALTEQIAALPGVAHAAAVIELTTHSADAHGGALLVLGVDFLGDTFFLPFTQREGRSVIEDPLAFVNDPSAILVSHKLAAEHGLALGDALPLATPGGVSTFHVRGLLEDSGPAASFGGQVAVMFLDAAQLSFGRGESVDRIDVALRPGASREQVQRRIQAAVAGVARAEPPEGRGRRLVGALWAFRNGLNMSGLMALCVGAFLIYNAVSVSVAQRRREVGTLRALGVTRRRMIWLFCVEALVLAAAGVALGLLLAEQLARWTLSSVTPTVNRFFMPVPPGTPQLSLRMVLAGALAGFGTTLFAAYIPALGTARVDPAAALRASRWAPSFARVDAGKLALYGLAGFALAAVPLAVGGELNGYLANLAILLGTLLLVPAWLKLVHVGLVLPAERWLGIPGRLALDNIERALGRSAVTVGALMLSVALSVSVGTYAGSFEDSWLDWCDQAFPADALLSAGSPVLDRNHRAFSPRVLEQLDGTPGLAGVNPIRLLSFDLGERRALIQAADTRIMFTQGERLERLRPVLAGPAHFAPGALYEAQRVLISENTALQQRLAVGDRFEFSTPTGPRSFEIYAVVVDYTSDQGWFLMDRRWFTQYWGDQLVDGMDLFFAAGSKHDQVERQLRSRLAGVPDLFVSSHEAVRVEMRGAARALFAYAKAPELICLVVAIMGVIGTMLAAVLDRTREIGMLRAIGATRRQVATSLVAEAGFLGLSAALYGLLVGVPLGFTLLRVVGAATSGWRLPYVYPFEGALRTASLVVLAAALSAFLPGKRAAALEIKEALGYE
jgi:putative ABC transport system permease protein